MKPPVRFMIGWVLVLVFSGCVVVSGKFLEPFAQAFVVVLEPVVVVGTSCGAYWANEQKWPRSMDDIAPLGGGDEKWKAMLERLSNVSFTPREDGSLVMKGLVLSPSVPGHNPSLTMHFVATITVRKDPKEASGWHVDVAADLSDGGKLLKPSVHS